MEIRQEKNKVYSFDMDKNGFPALTQKNVDLVNFLIDNDSNYRYDADPENNDSTYNLIKNSKETRDVEIIKKIVKKIDKQNSTHQASEGAKGGGDGINITASYISEIDNLYGRLKEEDPTLVNEIAKAIPTRYTFSFASKYCNYMSRYLFDADGYSIYDDILCKILPYYAWVYIKENHKAQKKSKIAKTFAAKDKGDYKGYRDLIDRIRQKAFEETGYKIGRVDFDHLLWYYYKGDRDIKNDEGDLVYESRITQAMKCVGEEESIVVD